MWKVNLSFKRSFVPHLQKKKEKSFWRNLSSASFFASSVAAAAAKQVTDVYHVTPSIQAGEWKRGKCLTSWNHYKTIKASLVTPWRWFYGPMCEMNVLNLNPKKSPGVVLSLSVFSCVTGLFESKCKRCKFLLQSGVNTSARLTDGGSATLRCRQIDNREEKDKSTF